MDWFDVILIALVAWRLANLIVSEDGPLYAFRRVRELFGIAHHDSGTIANVPEKFMAKLFSCVWCMGFWTTLIAYGLWLFFPIVLYLVAAWTLLIIIDRVKG